MITLQEKLVVPDHVLLIYKLYNIKIKSLPTQ